MSAYQLIENAIREDVHLYDEAMSYKALLETQEPQYDLPSIAVKTGRSVTHIYQRLRLADLIPDATAMFALPFLPGISRLFRTRRAAWPSASFRASGFAVHQRISKHVRGVSFVLATINRGWLKTTNQ